MSIEAKQKLIRIMGTFDLATGHADTFDELLDSLESELRDVLGYYRQMHTWVGLTDEETRGCIEATIEITDPLLLDAVNAVIIDVERLLREKNT